MRTEIERTWHQLLAKADGSPINSGGFRMLLVDEHSKQKCYGGVDAEGGLFLAIEVGAKPLPSNIRSGVLDYLRHRRAEFKTWLMILRLRSGDLKQVFGRLCQDLIDESQEAEDEGALIRLVHNRLALWQKLFDLGKQGLLQEFQVKGLIAELLFMDSLLSAGQHSSKGVVLAWVGPCGADQDFQFAHEAVEVKAVGPDAEGVSISSLQQLESAGPIRLSVWTLQKTSSREEGAVTLNGIVATLEERLGGAPAELRQFRERLIEAGYVELPAYDDLAFRPLRQETFVVDSGFPRLTVSSVPDGISSASYIVSLHSIRQGQ